MAAAFTWDGSTDRPVWIAALAATFVPVVQTVSPPPSGPYLSRGRGLTPLEQGLTDLDRLGRRIRLRNQRLAVPPSRRDDAAAAYTTPAFLERLAEYRLLLRGLADGQRVVGVLVADDRGIYAAHLQPDAARFQRAWPTLLEGIAMDAAFVEAAGLEPTPKERKPFEAEARVLLGALDADPMARPNFGVGWEILWPVPGEDARWHGLLTPQGLAVLSLYRNPPRPGAKAGGVAGGTTGGGGEPSGTPGLVELARRGPRTPYEARLLERRADLLPGATPRAPGGGGAGAKPPAGAPRSGPSRAESGSSAPARSTPAPSGGGSPSGGGFPGGAGGGIGAGLR